MLIELDDKSKTQWQKHIDVICRELGLAIHLNDCDTHVAVNYSYENKPSIVSVEFMDRCSWVNNLPIIFVGHHDIVVFNVDFTKTKRRQINSLTTWAHFFNIRDLAVKAFESQGVY